jgi:hypothetical protein
VEFHALGIMRKLGLKKAALTINRFEGPCPDCIRQLPKMLDEGEEIFVQYGQGAGSFTTGVFTPMNY